MNKRIRRNILKRILGRATPDDAVGRHGEQEVRVYLRQLRQRGSAPHDGFLRLLADAGDEDVVSGRALGAAAREYTPEAIGETVVEAARRGRG